VLTQKNLRKPGSLSSTNLSSLSSPPFLSLPRTGEVRRVRPRRSRPLPFLANVPFTTDLQTAMPFSGIFNLLYYILVSFADAPFQQTAGRSFKHSLPSAVFTCNKCLFIIDIYLFIMNYQRSRCAISTELPPASIPTTVTPSHTRTASPACDLRTCQICQRVRQICQRPNMSTSVD
jgi:hypothetical protein